MGFQLPWVKKKTERLEHRGTRDVNTALENELLQEAQDRLSVATEQKVDLDGNSFHNKWRTYDKIFRSDHWQEAVPDDKSMPVMNFTFSIIQSVLDRMTDTHPETLVLPRRSRRDSKLAEMLSSILKHLWYNNEMQEKQLGELLLHVLKYGTGITKTIWNPDLWDELGDVQYSVVHPMNFFPDPRAYEIEQMDYCLVTMPKSIEYFLHRWEEKGAHVVPDGDWVDTENLEGRDQPSKESVATLVEYWFRDEDGNVCVMYYAGDVVLAIYGGKYDEDVPDEPIYKHNEFPFSKMVDYEIDKAFWGMGEIELVELIQQLINSFEAQIIDNTRLTANNQWIVNKRLSGLKEEDAWIFDNSPGNVIFTHEGGVDRIPGTPVPPHIPEHVEKLVFWMEQITGVFDVVQGRRPTGVRAASAIIALQEAASIRIRQKARRLGATIRKMSEQAVSLVLEHYDDDRTMRLAGELLPITLNVREAVVQRMVEEAAQTDMGAEMGLPPELMEAAQHGLEGPGELPAGMQDEMFDQLAEQVKFPPFDVEIKVGASVPYSQALLYEQAKEFYQLGAIDRQALLEATNFPHKEEILQRMAEAEAAAAEAQAAGDEAERTGERF